MATANALSSYTNHGRQAIHLGAPGNRILSTAPGDGYEYESGTSAAAAFVAGVAALVYGVFASAKSETSAAEVLEILRVSSTPVQSLSTATLWGAIVNAEAAVSVARLGGMWLQIKCTDHSFQLQPGESKVARIYMRPFLPGEYRGQVNVKVNSADEQVLEEGGFEIGLSSSQYISLEKKQQNMEAAMQAEIAFDDILYNQETTTSDICDIQKLFLQTSSSATQGQEDAHNEGNSSIFFIATAGCLVVMMAAIAIFMFKDRLVGTRGNVALEKTYDEALQGEAAAVDAKFGDEPPA
ncbi:subtilisin-like protease [Cyclospora cayetanensis]|uniref:subtilisin n=1 Tax=Cyclospora cayetanensis TaxID=88456 RepID=A0A1D3CRJ4_9EIME|nr:subtilisin-like protease [Cyclospora cayetanensis]